MPKKEAPAPQWVKLKGKLIYDPVRPDIKKIRPESILILQPRFDDLDLLYQWFIRKRHGLTLQRPVWRAHVTVVNGKEKITHPELWKKYNNEFIEFEYSPHIEQHWKFWVLPVRSERLREIRAELGLKPNYDLHITIGRME